MSEATQKREAQGRRQSPMSARGQQRSSNDVCVTSAITPTAARKRTFRHFAFVP